MDIQKKQKVLTILEISKELDLISEHCIDDLVKKYSIKQSSIDEIRIKAEALLNSMCGVLSMLTAVSEERRGEMVNQILYSTAITIVLKILDSVDAVNSNLHEENKRLRDTIAMDLKNLN